MRDRLLSTMDAISAKSGGQSPAKSGTAIFEPGSRHLSTRAPGFEHYRNFWNVACRKLAQRQLPAEMQEAAAGIEIRSAMTPGAGLGAALIPQPTGERIRQLTAVYGAYRTLGVEPITSPKAMIPVATAEQSAEFVLAAAQGTAAITEDTALAGTGLTVECREVASIKPVANAVLEDATIDISFGLERIFAQGIAARIDFAAFSADGTADGTDGGMTGLIQHGSVAVVTAGQATTSETLDAEDCFRTMDAVSAGAMQRKPSWWIHPTIFRKMMRIQDNGGSLVKFEAGVPYLAGYPVNLVAAMPSTNTASSRVAIFGAGDAYTVAIRDELLLAASASARFDYNVTVFRCIARIHCQMADAAAFAILALHS